MNMKKKSRMLLVIAIVSSLLITPAYAQKSSGGSGKCYDENSHLINLGVGVGRSYYKYNHLNGWSSGRTPVFLLSYEQPLRNKVGPGYIGVGGVFAYQNEYVRYDGTWLYKSDWYDYYYRQNWDYYVIAGRATYHWDVLNSGKAEVYGGAEIGARFNSYRYTTNNPDPNYKGDEWHEGSADGVVAAFVGARWYFVPNVALYSEVATGVCFISGGLTFKF